MRRLNLNENFSKLETEKPVTSFHPDTFPASRHFAHEKKVEKILFIDLTNIKCDIIPVEYESKIFISIQSIEFRTNVS